MKISNSNGRKIGTWARIALALTFIFGIASTASAAKANPQVPFPGLDGFSNSYVPASFDSPNHYDNTNYSPTYNNTNFNDGPHDMYSSPSNANSPRLPSNRPPDGWSNANNKFHNRYQDQFNRSRPAQPNQTRYGKYGPAAPRTNDHVPSYDEWYQSQYGRTPAPSGPYDTPYTAPVNNRPSDRFDSRDTNPLYDTQPAAPAYNPQPAPTPIDPAIEQQQKEQQEISFRYRNPVLMRFLKTLSPQQAVSLYREINSLVDKRHLEPTSYSQRVERSASNLMVALQNNDFQTVENVRLSPQQLQAFRNSLTQTVSAQSVRSQSDAVQSMQRATTLGQRIGLSPAVVAIEFIFGTTDTLDKYSAFVPDDVRNGPSASAVEDSVVGIGVEVKMTDEGMRIERVLNNSPAQEAGLLAGDVILNVDGHNVVGTPLSSAADLIGGPSGSRVTLGIKRNGGSAFAVSMIRRRVDIDTVSDVRMLDAANGVGYIRLDKFAEKSADEVDAALWKLHGQGMKSLVFDLRGNPGGLLTTVVKLANKFLPQGVIVSTKGRLPQDDMKETATLSQTWKVPLVVLVDENSASASEIFAAAIQENHRGVIVGRKTYGKGTVQTHFPLQSVAGALRLTTARFYSPNGRAMAGAGVTPDLPVEGFKFESRSLQQGDKDVAAALGLASRPELAEMAARSALPQTAVPALSLSDRS